MKKAPLDALIQAAGGVRQLLVWQGEDSAPTILRLS